MKKLAIIFLLLIHFVSPIHTAGAADELLIRTHTTPQQPWLGQKITLYIDILVAGGWAQVKTFRDTPIEDGYLLRFESQGTRLNETIDGASYSGQRYEFFFFARRPGQVVIPEIPMDIEVKRWGQAAGNGVVRKSSHPITLDVKPLPGVDPSHFFVSTTDYSSSQQWDVAEDQLNAGDAITRRITRQAADVSAMLFSPLYFPALEGLAIYPGEPEIEDKYDRGNLAGIRTEKVTYIFEQPGTFILPELVFLWWDTNGEQQQEIILPGRTIEVSGEPAATATSVEPSAQKNYTRLLLIPSLIILLLLGLIFSFRQQITKFFRLQRAAWKESEPYYFRRIAKAVTARSPEAVIRTTIQWLDRISVTSQPARLDQFLERYGDNDLRRDGQRLMSLKPNTTSGQELKQFHKGLLKARARWQKESRRQKKANQILPEISIRGREQP